MIRYGLFDSNGGVGYPGVLDRRNEGEEGSTKNYRLWGSREVMATLNKEVRIGGFLYSAFLDVSKEL